MESWSYVSGEKNFVSEESVCASDGIPRGSKNGLMGWELKSSSSFENISLMCSSQEGIKNQEFVELGCSSDMIRKSLVNDSITDVLRSQYGCGGRRVYNPITAPPPNDVVYGEEESSSKLSSSIVDSNCRDSSLIDLKLGRFLDHHKDASSTKVSNPNFSSAESPIPPKRARAGSLNSQTSFCQVHGCKKDLSSSKDYHKRHKVCEIHSKTTKVIVNGIEQRFCQQCSRFHLLAEFDDGKRSCRKRLAGHNERRRKPRSAMHSGRAGGMFQSYNVLSQHGATSTRSRYQGANTFAPSSFVCQDILPGSLVHQQKYEMNDWYRNVKVEDEADYSPQLGIPNTKGETHSKSHMTSFNTENHCHPSMHDDGLVAVTRSKMHENSNSFLHNMSTSDLDSRPLFHHNSSLGSEELTVLNSSSTVQGIPGLSNSGCALSLLSSSRSQNSSNQSSGIPTVLPLISPGCHSHYNVTRVSEKLIKVSPQTSTSGVSNAFHPSGITSNEDTQMEAILISDGIDSVSYGINGIIHGSGYMNTKDNVSCGDGSTIDLLQLSSQLQSVEHQRQSMQVKQETNAFFGLRIT